MEEKLPKQELNEQPQARKWDLKKYLTRRNILIGVIALLVVLIIILSLAVRLSNRLANNNQPTSAPYLNGSILFDPATVTTTPNKPTTVYVSLNTGGQRISGAVIAIKYSPLALGNVKLASFKDPTSAISNSLEQSGPPIVNTNIGTALITLSFPNGVPEQSGVGKIAALTFTPRSINVSATQTKISFTASTSMHSTTKGQDTQISKNDLILYFNK